MATWNGALWNSGALWGAAIPPLPPPNPAKPKKKMKRQDYFPSRLPEQPEWLNNFAVKLALYGPTIPLAAAAVTAGQADAHFLAYALGDWINSVREFSPSCTAALDALQNGAGVAPFVLPTMVVPALPAGVSAVPAGALDRIFKLVQLIKNSPGYTDAMGLDLGIVGSVALLPNATPIPQLDAKAVAGPNGERGSLTFKKAGHTGAAIQSRRGASANFEDIGIATTSPFLDERPLLAAGVPEIREYRACYWDAGQPSGDWSPVVKITVAP